MEDPRTQKERITGPFDLVSAQELKVDLIDALADAIQTAEISERKKDILKHYLEAIRGGTLDLGLVGRLSDGRRVVIGEFWAMGPDSNNERVSLDNKAFAIWLKDVLNLHHITMYVKS